MFRKLLLALAAVCLMTGSAVAADAFPNRPITIVVPFAAGGETDLVARMLADGMSKELKQVMVVQNIVGASGVAGISAVTGAKPDGYTLGVTPSAPLAMHPHMRKVPYTLDSFDFVGRILKAPYIVMVAKTAPWNTLDDMLRDMKANPNTFFFASSGVGSVPYFAMMDLFKKAGAQVRHVPFSGDADAFQAIAGNRVQVYTSTAGSLDQYDVKGLALMDATRDPLLPNLPTVRESGVEAYYSQWMPLLAPKGLPADVKAEAARKAEERLRYMTFYSTTQKCLRRFMLNYFGEAAPEKCGNCSCCLFAEQNAQEVEQRAAAAKQRAAANSRRLSARRAAAGGDLSEADEKLLAALYALRKRLAAKQNVPAYMVFSDATLREMVRSKPLSMDEFLNITGVGEKKAARYGMAFLRAIEDMVGSRE